MGKSHLVSSYVMDGFDFNVLPTQLPTSSYDDLEDMGLTGYSDGANATAGGT
jgi:hypothetical protein